MVLIMSVEPGKGEQKLISKTLEKIKQLFEYRDIHKLEFDIQADGGINLETIVRIKEVGVDIAVVGSASLYTKDYTETIKLLKNKV